MKNWLRKNTAFLIAALALAGCSAGESKRILTIYHTNDIHGYIASREAGKLDEKNPKRLIGGFAALKNFIKAGKTPYLVLDSGDWFSGAPEGSLTGGSAVIEMMNHLGYTAAAIGNHEFDQKESNIRRLVKEAKFPFLAANIQLRYIPKKTEEDPNPSNLPDYVTPSIIKEIPELGLKVGIFGLITQNTPNVTMPSHVARLKFLRPVNAAKKMVRELRAQGCDLVIAVSHIGIAKEGQNYEDEKYLAANVPGLDLILGGHSHTYLKEAHQDPQTKTVLVQSGRYLTSASKIELELDEAKRVKGWKAELADLWVDRWGEDKETLEIIAKHKGNVEKRLSKVIGEAKVDLIPSRDGESNLGNLAADIFRHAAKAEIAFQNAGGNRDSILKGPVALRSVFSAFPFDNTLVTMELTGAEIREILETSVSGDAGSIMNVSGLRFRWDPRRPKKHRIIQVQAGGKPLGSAREYLVVTNSFLAQGGDGYKTFEKGQNKKDLGILVREAVASYIENHSPLSVGTDGRMASER